MVTKVSSLRNINDMLIIKHLMIEWLLARKVKIRYSWLVKENQSAIKEIVRSNW